MIVSYTCMCVAIGAATWSPEREKTARLVGGPDGSAGRLEIFTNGFWRSFCDYGWDSADADVVCRGLGYDGVVVAADRISFGPGGGQIAGSNMACSGSEKNISQCSYNDNLFDCTHLKNDIGVVCLKGN